MLKKNTTKASSLLLFFTNHWHVLFTIAAVTVVSLSLAYLQRNQLNPDGVSYIDIAKHYANLDIRKAINGYWSPLLSWLLTPAIWLKIDPLHAFKLINAALSIAASVAFLHLAKNVPKIYQALAATAIGITISTWSAQLITPDILSGIVLFVVILLSSKFIKYPTTQIGLTTGLSLALLYFAKSIGLYLSIAIAIFIIGKLSYDKRLARVKKSILAMALTFFLLSSLWIAAISIKYDRLTVSTAGPYNKSLAGPTHPPHPQSVGGVYLTPKYPEQTWAWSDPSDFSMPKWSILEHKHYFITNFMSNINIALQALVSLSPIIFIGIFGLLLNRSRINSSLLILMVSALTILAYSAILVEVRYLWIIAIPIALYGLSALGSPNVRLGSAKLLNPQLALVGFASAFSVIQLAPTIISIPQFTNQYDSVRKLTEQSTLALKPGSKVVGSSNLLYFCYFTNTQCLGQNKIPDNIPSNNNEIIIQGMKAVGAEYYFEYDTPRNIGLSVLYSGAQQSQNCYDYRTGNNPICPWNPLTIYAIE